MSDISSRILTIVAEYCNGNRSEFARKLGIAPGYAAQMCNGSRTPSDRTVSDICREFHVRREWLETGEGPMKLPEPEADLEIINDLLSDTAGPMAELIRNIWRTYRQLPPEDQQILDNFIRSLREQG